MRIGYSEQELRIRPWVVDVAGDTGVRRVVDAGDPGEQLFEDAGGDNTVGERDCLVAQRGFGVEEHGFVDELLAEERAVEVRAALEEEAQDVSFGQSGEDGGKTEAPVVVGDPIDFHVE
jgi:hypothetical protein